MHVKNWRQHGDETMTVVIDDEEIHAKVYYDFYPGQKQTYDQEGIPDVYEVTSIEDLDNARVWDQDDVDPDELSVIEKRLKNET